MISVTYFLIAWLILAISIGISWKLINKTLSPIHAIAATFMICIFGCINSFVIDSLLRYFNYHVVIWIILSYFNFVVVFHLFSLANPRLRSDSFLYCISHPSTVYFSTIVFSIPIVIFSSVLNRHVLFSLILLCFILAAIGLKQSLTDFQEYLELKVTKDNVSSLRRGKTRKLGSDLPFRRLKSSPTLTVKDEPNALKIVQITDPHLGPFVSIKRLQRICQAAVQANPDIILLTGDYWTPEGEHTFIKKEKRIGALTEALQPLKSYQGRVFASLGNHDLESDNVLQETISQLREVGVILLRNEEKLVNTRLGLIQLIAIDYMRKKNRSTITELCHLFKKIPDAKRIILLHDPAGFTYIPNDDGSLVFSGHTHGGQIGLLSLGLPQTIVGLVSPDHGLWAKGMNRLYVHRGQGSRFLFANFLVRLGVPTENSILYISWDE